MSRCAGGLQVSVMALTLAAAMGSPARGLDPCLLTLAEARRLAGSAVVESVADAGRCSYVTAGGGARLTLELISLASESAKGRLAELGDGSRYTSRQKGRTTIWLSRDDELDGWIRRGDVLLEVRADGEAIPRRRRALEQALVQLADRLE